MVLAQLLQSLQLLIHCSVRHAAHHDLKLPPLLHGALPVAAFGREGGAHQLGSAALQIRQGSMESEGCLMRPDRL